MTLLGPKDPAQGTGWEDPPPRKGFFTDTSVCIGCKACEVACKEWNGVPEDGLDFLGSSYDNTGALGASTWRHVAFIEQPRKLGRQDINLPLYPVGPSASAPAVDLGMPGFELPGATADPESRTDFRWLMSSDVCKHCTHAAAWTSARPARCSAPSSAPSSSRRTSATAAGTASRPARSA